ncbi:MAG: aromatic ring-hydroxylating dioxygenase subunit alpha [Proteobacteria bacterium]|nr:aromatic ring-hydroxylating dioxygenase subunit alpha [Pseudomonadota bacterium]
MTRHEEMLGLTRRALQHYRNGTTDQAPSVMRQPVAAYVDEARYQREVERVFKHLPQALALSIEIPKAGDYRAMQVLDVPVIVVRGKDGRARAFLNACRHRGAKVCQHGSGNARVFTCPYHAWAYNEQGALISRYAADTFGDVDHSTLGLTELDCAERAGLVFVKLTPGETLDIDAWLGDFAAELATLKLDSWHIHTQRELEGPGWKVALDGYLEAYHHNSLHGKTVGKMTIGNLLVLDTYGPHHRLTFGRKTLAELVDQPESSWEVDKHIRLIHNCFPNLSVSGILGDHCLVSQIFPGPTSTTTLTRQTVLVAAPPETEQQKAASELFSSMVLQAVRDEDYAVGRTIQDGLKSGANHDFLFGRNEPAVQNYHNTIARLMAGASR